MALSSGHIKLTTTPPDRSSFQLFSLLCLIRTGEHSCWGRGAQNKQNWALNCRWVPRDEEGLVHTLMLSGFLEPSDSGFYSRAISGDVPSGGWPREGQSQIPHRWGLMRTWREMPVSGRVSLSCSTGLVHGTAEWRDEDVFPPTAQSRATGQWVVPSHRPSPGGILLVLVGRKGHTQTQKEVSPKWTVNCLQARETCMIRTFRIGPGPWLGRDPAPAPAPWPLSFPYQLSRNPGQFQSLRLQPA